MSLSCRIFISVFIIFIFFTLRENVHSVVFWMWRNILFKAGAISEFKKTATGTEPATIWFVNEHSTILTNGSVCVIGWFFVYELSSCGFDSPGSHLKMFCFWLIPGQYIFSIPPENITNLEVFCCSLGACM